MSTLEKVYERAVEAREKCKRRVLLQSEVQEQVKELWSELLGAYPEDSEQWRIADRSRREHTNWWSVPKMSQYAEKDDCVNIEVIIRTIEEISGKSASRTPQAVTKKHSEVGSHQTPRAVVTGRTGWDIFETYKDRYGKKFVLGVIVAAVLLLAFVHWQTPVGKNVSLFGFNLYVKHGDAEKQRKP